MKKILVPVDFSDASSNALSYAIQLFETPALEITVLHIYGARSTALLMKNIDGVLEKDAKRRMDELLGSVQKEYPDITFRPKIIKSYAVSAISALGDTGNYDFIVMGTKGASGLKEVFMGSVAGGVVSKTSAPVIVVPDGHAFRPLERIVLAVSDNPFSDAKVVDPLRQIATKHESKIKVLHIADKKTPQIEKALSAIEDLNPSVDYAFGTGDTNKDLNDYLMKDFSGLVCLIRSKKGFLDRLLNESVTLKQTFNSPVPLLILHD
ncbi:universal stress protein [Allomuricauda sp. SCSIO 65647]|uniref:universal stress protein n=1 Tax=Allomuricauda sp. SCSIO 65647 TaxID=2908843 RepID=UPI001F39EA3E|nr:universal stress protein [Muricauda sp. SCSIO 65647]UJH69127.1 universal stress protein [Muricauda sp. SCSIO 65647]